MDTEFIVGNRVKVIRGEKLQETLGKYVGKIGVIHYIHPPLGGVAKKDNIQVDAQNYRRCQVRLRSGENIAFPEDWLEVLQ